MVTEIINSDIKSQIESGELFLLDFYADWCQPCKNMTPILEKFSEDNNINIGKCNIEENDDLISKYDIRNIPTVIFIKNDEVKGRLTGTKTYDQLMGMYNSCK